MNRRRFLLEGLACGGLVLGTGGVLFVRRSQARSQMTSRMLDEALPHLSKSSLRELNTLPVRAREEIRRYFHGKCLNVEGFVSHICSNQFVESLGRLPTADERYNRLNEAFCGRVASEGEILYQVETIAEEVGSELDTGWDAYCSELSGRWNTRIQGYGSPLAMDELTNRLDGMIRRELSAAVHDAVSATQRPALGTTVKKIGKSACLLLPIVCSGPVGLTVGVPVFFYQAATHIWDYVMGRLEDRRNDCQVAISRRLALLGNRVGAEFEREIRRRLTDLHTWRENAVRQTAERLVEDRIGLI